MPKIGERVIKQVDLPTDGAWVKILTNPKADLWENLSDASEEDAGSLMLSKLITEWNFTDDTSKIAPITQENIKAALSALDIAKINKELGLNDLFLSDAKKNSLSPTLQTKKAEATPQSNTQSSNTEKSST